MLGEFVTTGGLNRFPVTPHKAPYGFQFAPGAFYCFSIFLSARFIGFQIFPHPNLYRFQSLDYKDAGDGFICDERSLPMSAIACLPRLICVTCCSIWTWPQFRAILPRIHCRANPLGRYLLEYVISKGLARYVSRRMSMGFWRAYIRRSSNVARTTSLCCALPVRGRTRGPLMSTLSSTWVSR